MVRHPEDAVRGARLPDHPGPPPLTQITFLTCRAHYPGGPDRCVMVIQLARSRAGFFPIRSAFPAHAPGRRPHCSFRGLLELHTHYGLPGCSPTYRGLCHEVSASPVSRARRSIAIESNHQLFEWVLPPLVICPFGAHARVPAPHRPVECEKCSSSPWPRDSVRLLHREGAVVSPNSSYLRVRCRHTPALVAKEDWCRRFRKPLQSVWNPRSPDSIGAPTRIFRGPRRWPRRWGSVWRS